MHYVYRTHGTCSREINFDMDNSGVVTNISFLGGCNGNLKAVSKLVDGFTAQQIADKCLGITCGGKGTSCSDQLSHAVLEAYEKLTKK